MAEINVKYDTKTKSCCVTQDGKEMPNVHSVRISKNYPDYYDGGSEADEPTDKYGMEIHTVDKSQKKEHGYHTHTHVTASENGDLQFTIEKVEASTEPTKELSDFIGGILDNRRSREKKGRVV